MSNISIKSSGSKITITSIQLDISWDIESNLKKINHFVIKAATNNAQLVVLQELISTPTSVKRNPTNI